MLNTSFKITEQKNQVTRAEQNNDYRVVVFGAGGVGKSSLVLRFIKGTFRESYIPTIEDTYRQVSIVHKDVQQFVTLWSESDCCRLEQKVINSFI